MKCSITPNPAPNNIDTSKNKNISISTRLNSYYENSDFFNNDGSLTEMGDMLKFLSIPYDPGDNFKAQNFVENIANMFLRNGAVDVDQNGELSTEERYNAIKKEYDKVIGSDSVKTGSVTSSISAIVDDYVEKPVGHPTNKFEEAAYIAVGDADNDGFLSQTEKIAINTKIAKKDTETLDKIKTSYEKSLPKRSELVKLVVSPFAMALFDGDTLEHYLNIGGVGADGIPDEDEIKAANNFTPEQIAKYYAFVNSQKGS